MCVCVYVSRRREEKSWRDSLVLLEGSSVTPSAVRVPPSRRDDEKRRRRSAASVSGGFSPRLEEFPNRPLNLGVNIWSSE